MFEFMMLGLGIQFLLLSLLIAENIFNLSDKIKKWVDWYGEDEDDDDDDDDCEYKPVDFDWRKEGF